MTPSAVQTIAPPVKAGRKSDLRRLLFILLIGSWSALILAIGAQFLAFQGSLRDRELAETSLRLMQHQLERRLSDLETASLADRNTLEEKLKLISARQDANARQQEVAAPFPIDAVMRAVVQVVCIDNEDADTYYSASGTVIDRTGLVLTNRHILVSKDGSVIRYCGIGFTSDLKVPPALDYIATMASSLEQNDLALLRISERVDKLPLPPEFAFISVAGSADAARNLRLGDQVYIGGYPDVGADTFTFTQGVVSGRLGSNYIKTSALIDTGASGGGGFDGQGRFIGVPTAAAKGEIGGSLGYLIGADIVDAFMTDFFSKRR